MAIQLQKALVNEGKTLYFILASYLIEKRELFPAKTFRYAVLKNETLVEKKFF
jgi:hypothetical protein